MSGETLKQLKAVDHSAEALTNARGKDAEREFYRFLGAVGFSEKLTSALSAQNLYALDHIKREKLYVSAGYQTFDDFLDHDPNSPMKSETFRRRWNLLKAEGDDTFNLLNSMKVPFETRKLLAGQIEVTESEIKIGDTTIRRDNQQRLLELISLLHKKDAEQQRTIDRQGKKLKQGEEDYEKLKRKMISINPEDTPLGESYLKTAGKLANLLDDFKEAPEEEKAAMVEPIFELLRVKQLEFSVEAGLVSKSEIQKSKSSDNLGITDDEAQDLLGD